MAFDYHLSRDGALPPCQLGAHSLLCAQPLFFGGALPAIIIFFALLQLLTQGRALAPAEQPV